MKLQLITLSPIALVTQPVGGYLPQRTIVEGQEITAPEGHAYVPVLEQPAYDTQTHRLERSTTLEGDGWQIVELTEEELAMRQMPPDVLTTLNTAFEEAIPAELRPAFASTYAVVRVLIQAEQYDLARATIANTPVPPELAGAKAQLLTLVPAP